MKTLIFKSLAIAAMAIGIVPAVSHASGTIGTVKTGFEKTSVASSLSEMAHAAIVADTLADHSVSSATPVILDTTPAGYHPVDQSHIHPFTQSQVIASVMSHATEASVSSHADIGNLTPTTGVHVTISTDDKIASVSNHGTPVDLSAYNGGVKVNTDTTTHPADSSGTGASGGSASTGSSSGSSFGGQGYVSGGYAYQYQPPAYTVVPNYPTYIPAAPAVYHAPAKQVIEKIALAENSDDNSAAVRSDTERRSDYQASVRNVGSDIGTVGLVILVIIVASIIGILEFRLQKAKKAKAAIAAQPA